MRANPICKTLEEEYISLFKKVGCEVTLDEEGIHASASKDKLCIMDNIFFLLEECRVPHKVHIGSDGISILIRERYFKEDKEHES